MNPILKFNPLTMILLHVALLSSAFAQGDKAGGGGDPCEDRFKDISFYLQKKTNEGLGAQLSFKNEGESKRYFTALTGFFTPLHAQAPTATQIECTSKKVWVDHVEWDASNTQKEPQIKTIS